MPTFRIVWLLRNLSLGGVIILKCYVILAPTITVARENRSEETSMRA